MAQETLTLANIRASRGSTRKAPASCAASQGASVEAGDLVHTSTMYGHYLRYLPREVLVRIIEQTLGSIQEVNIAAVATDNPL